MQETLESCRNTHELWGRLVESSIGAHIVNSALEGDFEVYYWRDRNKEVDFVLKKANSLVAIEVKSGFHRNFSAGLDSFERRFGSTKKLLVGEGGMSVEDFLLLDLTRLF